jgi:hypothetical protein
VSGYDIAHVEELKPNPTSQKKEILLHIAPSVIPTLKTDFSQI